MIMAREIMIVKLRRTNPPQPNFRGAPTAGAIPDRFLHHAQAIAITGRSYRLKDHAAIAGKEDKNKKTKSESSEPLAAEAAS
jgi:hypothetical protein